MKIIIITQNEPFFIPKVLNNILESYKNHIFCIVFLKPDEYKNKIKYFNYYLRFWGIFQFIKISLIYLRHLLTKEDYLKNFKYIKNINVNSEPFVKISKRIDYIISIASNQIFKAELLNSPKQYCLNIHAGLLPLYRGFNPSFWVLKNNEKITGVTLHIIEECIDCGPIILQKRIKITNNESWFSLQNKVTIVAGDILVKIFPNLIKNQIKFKKQLGKNTIFRRPSIIDGKIYRLRGKRFV